MSKKEKKFDDQFMRRIRQVSRTKMINALLKDYYEETYELAQTNPKCFGNSETIATKDPKSFAKSYAKDYRQVLMSRERDYLEILYANFVRDNEEIDIESKLE